MNITVLGCGRWGSFLAWYHARRNPVTLWGREASRGYQQLLTQRKNAYVTLPDNVTLTSDLKEAVAASDVIVISISAQQLRELAVQLNKLPIKGKMFILCMKGIEADTGLRLTQVFDECVTQSVKLAVWVGPGHVQDFVREIPNCMVVDSNDRETVDYIVETFNTDLIRLYKGNDLVGTELGAAAKNVIGIAAGMLDGRGISSLKGALMARGAREVARLMKAMGANELSAYGLCHLGDYEATLFSKYSHNRMYGEAFIKNEPFKDLAEGVPTSKALVKLSKEYGVELPISTTIYNIVYKGNSADDELKALFARSVKGEFDT